MPLGHVSGEAIIKKSLNRGVAGSTLPFPPVLIINY